MERHGFTFSKRQNHYEHQRERADIVQKRASYLDGIQNYRDEDYVIYYQDETWVFKSMAQSMVWSHEDAREANYKVPSGSGDRCIVSHLGSAETGLLEGCLLMYRGIKANKSADYHSEMNTDVFIDWLKKKVFPKMKSLGKKCVLVLDRATYHTQLTPETKRMRISYSKPILVDAVKRWGGPPAD